MKIEDELCKTSAYPESPQHVEMLQTHISFIFITDDLVYKVKKPVDFGFLDFTSLEKRQKYCQKEVELNARLSPEVYLGVVDITDEGDALVIDGEGDVVEYAVKMRRIPMDRLMETLLEKGELTAGMVADVAKKIADFHSMAATSKVIDNFGSQMVIKTNTDENFQQTENYIGKSITRRQFEAIKKYTNDFFKNRKGLITKRITENKIRDCHGDLHMQHICMTDPIIIFDCIEFNDRFRYSDTAADIAFLAMDLDFHGERDFSQVLMEAYVKHSGDEDVYDMLNFYKIYRAYVRGKVISFQLDDVHISEQGKKTALDTAQRYFELAHGYVKEDRGR
jgi:aminoglycoside phosphotransferase family enzyme